LRSRDFSQWRRLEGDLVDDFTHGCGTFLNLLHLVIGQFLVEDGVDAILSNDDRHAQKHLLLYAVIALTDNQSHHGKKGQGSVLVTSLVT